MGRKVDIDKLEKDVEHNACSNCKNYNRGEFATECRLCRVSLVFQVLGWYKEGDEE